MNTCMPAEPLQPFITNACCLAAAIGAYVALTLSIVGEGPGNYAVFKATTQTEMAVRTEKSGGSQYVKSNQFMLKDALCNFTNGELVCHRATGLRHLSQMSGS